MSMHRVSFVAPVRLRDVSGELHATPFDLIRGGQAYRGTPTLSLTRRFDHRGAHALPSVLCGRTGAAVMLDLFYHCTDRGLGGKLEKAPGVKSF